MGNHQEHLHRLEAPPVSVTKLLSCGPTTCGRSHKGPVLCHRSTLDYCPDFNPAMERQKKMDLFLSPAISKKKKRLILLWKLFCRHFENRFYINLWVSRQTSSKASASSPSYKNCEERKKDILSIQTPTAAVKYGIPPFAIKLLTKTKPKPKPCQIGGALINVLVAQDDSCGGRHLSLIWASCQGADCQRGGKLEQLDDGWFMACDKRAWMARVFFIGFLLSAAYCNILIFWYVFGMFWHGNYWQLFPDFWQTRVV